MNKIDNPFALNQLKDGIIKSIIQGISKVDVLERFYTEWLDRDNAQSGETDKFITYALDKLGIHCETVNGEQLNNIPKDGAFMIVANHPLGGIEGLLLTQLLRSIRPDLKVLTNELLSKIPEFSDIFIGVDVLNQNQALRNAKGMRDVARHLSAGGALLVFPAGTVSRIHLPSLKIADTQWNSIISRLAHKYNASVMPIFVEAQNTKLFYLSAYIHKRLRTMLLPRSMLAKSGETIRLHMGQIVPASDLKRISDDTIAMSYLHLCCQITGKPPQAPMTRGHKTMDKIRQDRASSQIVEHLDTLDEFRLLRQNGFAVYCAPYNRLGPVMEQLSIERERTFRAVDEGTGKDIDSDVFDSHYMHLLLWDETAQQIAGGYRIGKTDKITKPLGLKGLYSHSLFDYNAAFLNDMGKTLEVGRSFISQNYQRNPTALDLLWKGIGHYIAKNPEYHTLFGCVSISRQYSHLASSLLSETFLSHYGVNASIARKVKPRVPLKPVKNLWTAEQLVHLNAIPIINKLVGRIDPGKSLPILIRHYLALNGRFISFTVNNGFNDALDGLIMVDLRNAPERYLKRYMGADGMNDFAAFHDDQTYLHSQTPGAL